MAGRVQQVQVGAGSGADPCRRRRGAGPARRRAVAAQTASSGVMPISRTATATQKGMERGEGRARVAVRGQRDGGARVEQAARVGVGGAGGELGAGQQRGDRVGASASASTSASVRWVQWSAEAAPSSTASRTPGPWPSWLAWTRGIRPAAAPGGRGPRGPGRRRRRPARRRRRSSGRAGRRRPASRR